MKFMLLIHQDETVLARRSAAERQQTIDGHRAFARSLGSKFVYGAGLEDSEHAVTVHQQGGASKTTDGPPEATKLQFGGFYIVDVADRQTAAALAQSIPLGAGGAVEVRPLVGG